MDALHLLCFALCATTAVTAHKVAKRAEDIGPECLPNELGGARLRHQWQTATVLWNHTMALTKCLEDGASYFVNVTWTIEDWKRYEETVPLAQGNHIITRLSPLFGTSILVSLCYKDKTDNVHCGVPTQWNTTTAEQHPGQPENFRVTEAQPGLTIFMFDPPRTPNVPLNGYIYEDCKSEACDREVPEGRCGAPQELAPGRRTFNVRRSVPGGHYVVRLRAYRVGSQSSKTLEGRYVQLCVRDLGGTGVATQACWVAASGTLACADITKRNEPQ